MSSFQTILAGLQTGFNLLVILTILVAVHELGHYWVARLCGMKVDAFAVMAGGIRKTRLEEHLEKPLVSPWAVGIPYGLTALGTLVALIEKNPVLATVGLFLLAFPFPVWVVLRIGRLYHMPPLAAMQSLFTSWLVGMVLALGSTGFRIPDVGFLFGVFTAASFVAVLLTYYRPVIAGKGPGPETEEMGHGSIETATGETIPVRFRPPLHWTNKEGTEFAFLLWPVGGFARIRGMHPKEDGSEVTVPYGFYSKPPIARLAVLFAGPAFSIALGIGLLFAAFVTYGTIEQVKAPILGRIAPDSPASQAGLRPDDRVVSVNGNPTNTFFDIVRYVRDEVGDVTIVVDRNGERVTVRATPKRDSQPTPVLGSDMNPTGAVKIQSKLMIGPKSGRVQLSPSEAFWRAFYEPSRLVRALGTVFSSIDNIRANVSGPATVAATTKEATQYGFEALLLLAGALSISLGVMNLLPVPPLDGGQMLVAFVEMLRGGRRLSLALQNSLTMVGFMLVIGMMLLAVSTDIGRFGASSKPVSSSGPPVNPDSQTQSPR